MIPYDTMVFYYSPSCCTHIHTFTHKHTHRGNSTEGTVSFTCLFFAVTPGYLVARKDLELGA